MHINHPFLFIKSISFVPIPSLLMVNQAAVNNGLLFQAQPV